MAQEPNEIREHIDAERSRLGDDLEEIEHRMKDAVDWKTWYRKNTVPMLGAALAGGFLLSMAIGRSSNGSQRTVDTDEGLFNGAPERKREQKGESFMQSQMGSRISHHLSGLTEILDNTVGAFLGIASNKLQDYVSQSIPGFKEQYSEVQRARGRL